MAADCNAPATLSDISTKDTNRLVGRIAESLTANSAFINLLGGGTFASGVSDQVRSSVQMPAAPGDSLAIPTFVNDTEVCGTVGDQDKTDTIEFTYRLKTKRGLGPRVCMKQGYSAYRDSYLMAADSLVKLITQYVNADIRAQLYLQSASKFVAAPGYCFEDLFTGGEHTDVGVLFANVVPDAPTSFKAVHAVARYLKEALFADMFPAGDKGQSHFRFIGSPDIIESFRNELDVKSTLLSFVNGSYRLGEVSMSGYSFESSPAYRGIAFGIDQTPLRASGFNPDGTLAVIDPRVIVANLAKNTAYSKSNPAWLKGTLEVAFLVAQNSFKRLVPERYVGEGTFKFAPQMHAGELEWHYQIDNDCNIWGDYGWHKYQITRAYQPVRPHHIVPILYRRCQTDLGLEACASTSCPALGSL